MGRYDQYIKANVRGVLVVGENWSLARVSGFFCERRG